MTEIPEHLLKRAAERRAALESKNAEEEPAAAGGGGAGAAGGGAGAAGGGAAPAEGGGPEGGAVATIERAAGVATGGRVAAPPVGSAGHTQRLLTVVKAGSIQDVKATPTDKVNVWPHLLVVEFAASLAMTAFLTLFSIFVNAPLLQLANPNLTPNPSKAPWYFLGLQEMLTMFHPMVAGVTIPGIALGVLGAAGYIDKNPSHRPEDRKFAIALFTFFMMFWAVLVLIGSFFRGEGQNFILPWRQGVHDIFDL
jgi:menaquinol-cytochrome c reductase cytochrome b/c subunit